MLFLTIIYESAGEVKEEVKEADNLECLRLSPGRRSLRREIYVDQDMISISQHWENTPECEKALQRRVAELNLRDEKNIGCCFSLING